MNENIFAAIIWCNITLPSDPHKKYQDVQHHDNYILLWLILSAFSKSTTNRNNDCSARDKCFPQYCSSKHCNIQVTHSSVGPFVWIAYALLREEFLQSPCPQIQCSPFKIKKKQVRKLNIYIYIYIVWSCSFTKWRLECWVDPFWAEFLSHGNAPFRKCSALIRGCSADLWCYRFSKVFCFADFVVQFWQKIPTNASETAIRNMTIHTLKFEHKAAGRVWPTQQSSARNLWHENWLL